MAITYKKCSRQFICIHYLAGKTTTDSWNLHDMQKIYFCSCFDRKLGTRFSRIVTEVKSCDLTMYSIFEAGGYTWPLSVLCRSRISCISLCEIALLPLDLDCHHASSLSMYFSRMASKWVALGITMETTVWTVTSSTNPLNKSSCPHFMFPKLSVTKSNVVCPLPVKSKSFESDWNHFNAHKMYT